MQETRFDSWVRKIRWRRDRLPIPLFFGFPAGSAGKESAYNTETCVQSLVGRIPWRRERLPTPAFWPRGYHGLSIGSQRGIHDWLTFTFFPEHSFSFLIVLPSCQSLIPKTLKSYFFFLSLIQWVCACVRAKSLQLCPTLCNPMDCSPPGASVHGILQARALEWVTMLLLRGSSQPRNWTCVLSLALAGGTFTARAWEVYIQWVNTDYCLHFPNTWTMTVSQYVGSSYHCPLSEWSQCPPTRSPTDFSQQSSRSDSLRPF